MKEKLRKVVKSKIPVLATLRIQEMKVVRCLKRALKRPKRMEELSECCSKIEETLRRMVVSGI